MKVLLEQKEKKFEPVTLSITFEAKDELDCFAAMIGGTSAEQIKNNIENNNRLSKLFNANKWSKMSFEIWNEIDKITNL